MEEKRSRGDQLIEKLKANRKRPGQFSLTSLLGLMLLVAALFAVARSSGDPARFFALLYFVVYLGLPLIAYACAGIPPGLSSRARRRVELGLAALIAVPTLAGLAVVEGPKAALAGVLATVLWWGFQVLLLGMLHRLLFRD